MRKLFFALPAALLLLSACSLKLGPPPVLTNTNAGDAIVTIEPQRTADRKDIPQGSDPEDVIVIETKTGGKIYVDVKKKTASLNPQAQEEVKSIAIPKRSWRWLWLLVGALVLLYAIDTMLRRFLGVNPIRWIATKARGFIDRLWKWVT